MLRVFLLTLLGSSIPFVCIANLNVIINGSNFSFDGPTKLNEVLAPVAFNNDWYWPATKVYDNNNHDKTASTLRLQVLLALEKLIDEAKPEGEKSDLLWRVYDDIKDWKVANRVKIEVDYDRARLFPKHNPTFQKGNYIIHLSTRPSVIEVIGAVNESSFENHSVNPDINAYVRDRSRYANKEFYYIISPTGETEKIGRAYYNKNPVAIMPGSIIFVPFAEEVFFGDRMKNLNSDLLTLITYRVPD